MGKPAILDNWQSQISLNAQRLKELRTWLYSPPPGHVDTAFYRESEFEGVAYKRSLCYCKCVSWHHDTGFENSFLLILINDAHQVEGAGGCSAEYQGVGAVLKMNLRKRHRCKVLMRKSTGLLWASLAIDVRDSVNWNREQAEQVFRNELSTLLGPTAFVDKSA